ncbi:MAG: hypothetical protein HY706_03980 [Candidatus Hydrogenedentes bacterium]|nr:hypothetical protein [Candidatus Hydrogenedentota bacterium]
MFLDGFGMMWTLLLAMVAVGAGEEFPVRFLSPEDLEQAQGVGLAAQLPDETAVLISADPSQPQLWHMPVASEALEGEVRVWYQRVNKGEKEYSDQRTLCVGHIRGGAWNTPVLDPVPPAWGGANNVVLRRSPHPATWGGFNVFQMARFNNLYYLLYWDQPDKKGEAGAMPATSKDGLHWEKDPRGTVFTEHNDAYTLLAKDGEFLLYQTMLEDWPDKPYPDNLDKKRRVQCLRTSKDLMTWTPQAPLLRPDDKDKPEAEFYLMKVFAYGARYAALLMKYYADPQKPMKHSARLEYELLVSPDARHWQRPFRETNLGFWSYADPFVDAGKLCFAVYQESGMNLVKYRQNRLTGVTAETDGEFMTRPFATPPAELALDVNAADGTVAVDLLDANKTPLGGFGPCRVEGVNGEHVPLVWDGFTSTQIPMSTCRLRFRLHHATVYAITAAGK